MATTREPIIDIHPDAPNDADFLKTIDLFKIKLTDPDELIALAMHEAGHEYYYREMGALDFDYSGPSAGPGRDDFFGASIYPTSWADSSINLEALERIKLIARANTAGGSVTKFIVKRSDRGNQGDFKGFVTANIPIVSELKLKIDLKQVWDKAEKQTDREVRRLVTRDKIKKIAIRIKPLLFKWLD